MSEMRREFAEIINPAATGAEVRYATGFSNPGTGHNEVLQIVRNHPDGQEHRYVIMAGSGLTRAKAQAIVMILNADEGD